MNANNLLRNAGKNILRQFEDTGLVIQALKSSDKVETSGKLALLEVDLISEQERYQLWAANLGLFALGDRSLDYRRRDNTKIRDYTVKLLNGLGEDLSSIHVVLHQHPATKLDEDHVAGLIDLGEIELGEDIPTLDIENEKVNLEVTGIEDNLSVSSHPDQHKGTNALEFSSIEVARAEFDDVVDIIDRLYHLASKVRNTSTRHPPSARNFYQDLCLDPNGNSFVLDRKEKLELRERAKEQTERFHYRRIKELVRQARRDDAGKPEPEISERVRIKDTTKTGALSTAKDSKVKLSEHTKSVIRRIAIGNAYRQQQFSFWREREILRRSGSTQLDVQEDSNVHRHEASRMPPGPHASKDATDRKVAFSEIPSHTWKMPTRRDLISFDETQSQSSRSEHSITPTTNEPGGRKVEWPDFPEELLGQKSFICPYCFTTCPRIYRRKDHWREHLVQDLQPYTCTASLCREGDSKPLNTWEEWLVHEQVHHRMEYTCPEHPDPVFSDRKQYIDHIASVHYERDGESLMPEEIDKFAQPSPAPTEGCPLCNYMADTWQAMDVHLGFHLETLSLLALPISTGLEKDDENALQMGSLHPEGAKSMDEEVLQNVYEQPQHASDVKEEEQKDGRYNLKEQLTYDSLAEIEHENEKITTERSSREAVINFLHTDLGSSRTGEEITECYTEGAPSIRPMRPMAKRREDRVSGIEHDTATIDVPTGRSLVETIQLGQLDMAELLLEKDIEENAQGSKYGNALHAASVAGHERIVQLILDRGADVNSRGGEYNNALQAASLQGHERIVQLLLHRGADVNTHGGEYGSALQAAASAGHENIVKVLLDEGANIDAQGGEYGNALQAALSGGHEHVVKLLNDSKFSKTVQTEVREGTSWSLQSMRVAVAGTSGLALLIGREIEESTSHQLVFLSRTNQTGLISQGYICQVVDYTDPASLQSALLGVDTVISTVLGDAQLALIDAAVYCGVRRFAPAEFEGQPGLRSPLCSRSGRDEALNKLLHSYHGQIQYTVFVCGILYERFAVGGLLAQRMGIETGWGHEGDFIADPRNMIAHAPVWDAGQKLSCLCLTSMYDVAQFVVASLDLTVWPAEMSMCGERMTVNQLVDTIRTCRNRQWNKIEYLDPANIQYQMDLAGLHKDRETQQRLAPLLHAAEGRYDYAVPAYLNQVFPNIATIGFRDWFLRMWASVP